MDTKTESRVTIRWTGLVAINLEGEFEELLAGHGYEVTDKGRDLDGDQERVLVFRLAKEKGDGVITSIRQETEGTGLEGVEIFRSSSLEGVTFQRDNGETLKITYWANNTYITPARIVKAAIANWGKAMKLPRTMLWVPGEATIHLD